MKLTFSRIHRFSSHATKEPKINDMPIFIYERQRSEVYMTGKSLLKLALILFETLLSSALIKSSQSVDARVRSIIPRPIIFHSIIIISNRDVSITSLSKTPSIRDSIDIKSASRPHITLLLNLVTLSILVRDKYTDSYSTMNILLDDANNNAR